MEPLKYKERANRMSQACKKWGNRFFAQAASCCIPPQLILPGPLVLPQPWRKDSNSHKMSTALAPGPWQSSQNSQGLSRTCIRTIQLQDTHVSKPASPKGWTLLWHRQWQWQSWETGREKREAEKALGAHFLQSCLHRRGCTAAQSTGLQFAMLLWACLYKVLRRDIKLMMINSINYPFQYLINLILKYWNQIQPI